MARLRAMAASHPRKAAAVRRPRSCRMDPSPQATENEQLKTSRMTTRHTRECMRHPASSLDVAPGRPYRLERPSPVRLNAHPLPTAIGSFRFRYPDVVRIRTCLKWAASLALAAALAFADEGKWTPQQLL